MKRSKIFSEKYLQYIILFLCFCFFAVSISEYVENRKLVDCPHMFFKTDHDLFLVGIKKEGLSQYIQSNGYWEKMQLITSQRMLSLRKQ